MLHHATTGKKQVTRFAPTPSGYLHLGHAFAALTAYRARGRGGSFLLRIEDIDFSRCRSEFVDAIFEDLRWLGLDWEKPVRHQSQHIKEYQSARSTLADFTYPCFCTRAEIKAEIKRAVSAPHDHDAEVYPQICTNLSPSKRAQRIADGEPYAERLNVRAALVSVGEISWHEVGHGSVCAQPQLFGDVVLARKDIPTSYHLSVTVDDHLQGITLVTRGADLATSTDLHRLLQALLGYSPPQYHHHPLLTDANGRRLAKRDHDITIRGLRESGYSAREVVEMAFARVTPTV